MDKNDFNSLKDMEKDIILHPNDDMQYLDGILNSNLFTQSEINDINSALGLILHDERLSEKEKVNLLDNSWKINHKFKPPTPEEFLTEDWIGGQAKDIYPHCKQVFLDYFNPLINKNTIILYAPIGYGKTTLLALMTLYRSVISLSYRDIKKQFKLSKSTRLCNSTVSFTKGTAFDMLIAPIINIMEISPKFERVRYERDLFDPSKREEGKLLFCNTSKGNALIRIDDIFYECSSSPQDLIGRTTVAIQLNELCNLSKLMPEDRIMEMLNEAQNRIISRFGKNSPNASLMIDSSPNSLESRVDQWIDKHKNDDDILYVNTTKWAVQPWVFPIWEKDHSKTFPVFKGTSTQPTKIITEEERKNYDPLDIVDFPIDLLSSAKDDVAKTMRDFGAIPTAGSDTKLFTNHELINKCFVPNLKNFYMFEYASYLLAPEQLLWDKVRPLFYVYTGQGNSFRLKRYPSAERFVHIDMAEKKDMAGISMIHLETDKLGRKMYVADFTLPIMSKKDDKINLDSFKYLVYCMKFYGNTNIKKVTYDGFESKSSIQFLERNGFECERLSLDLKPDYYLSFASWVMQGRVKIGKNLVMKNNMKSLITTNGGHNGKESKSGKLIVDHVQGDWIDLENSDWENSKCGYFGKDLADSFVGACTNADMTNVSYAQWLYDEDEENIEDLDEKMMSNVVDEIYEKFGLKFKKKPTNSVVSK